MKNIRKHKVVYMSFLPLIYIEVYLKRDMNGLYTQNQRCTAFVAVQRHFFTLIVFTTIAPLNPREP